MKTYDAERCGSGAADSGSEARADAVCRRLQPVVRPGLTERQRLVAPLAATALPRWAHRGDARAHDAPLHLVCMRPPYEGCGPDQSNGICLLDLPAQSHWNPGVVTKLAVALPQVATCPGPTSEPGGFSICTRCPGGVIGPVNASACATTLPGTSARQKARSLATSNVMGTTSMPSASGAPKMADNRAGTPPACPLKTVWRASCCWALARASRKSQSLKSVACPAQRLPSKLSTSTRLRPSS